jgi:hypothetical protein
MIELTRCEINRWFLHSTGIFILTYMSSGEIIPPKSNILKLLKAEGFDRNAHGVP